MVDRDILMLGLLDYERQQQLYARDALRHVTWHSGGKRLSALSTGTNMPRTEAQRSMRHTRTPLMRLVLVCAVAAARRFFRKRARFQSLPLLVPRTSCGQFL